MSTVATKKLRFSNQDDLTGQAVNFHHLYWDVVWFGLAFGSTLSFLTVYATRLGASGWQIGLLTAGPALINILATMPAGRWLERQALGPAVTRTAFWHRLGYFILIPLPFLVPASLQIWVVLSLILLMAIPGTALAIGFNALLATAVPEEKRGMVVGRRNALLAVASGASFLLSGWLLDVLKFEQGYGVVFALGAIAGGMSTYHIYRIRISDPPRFQMRSLSDRAQPGRPVGFSGALPQRLHIGLRLWLRRRGQPGGNLGQVSTGFKWMMGAFFLFHFSQVVPAALFPIFWVREARLTDGEIGWLNGIFYLTMLFGSLFLAGLTRRFGNYRLTVAGALLLGLYPLLTALSTDIKLLLAANILGGVVWAILSGSLGNRLLEQTPADSRPAHLALYNLALNVAILSGTMLGPFLAHWTGLREALLVVAALRAGSALALARWG